MSRSWRNASNKPSVGFLYFDPDNSQSSGSGPSMDTSDFVSFGSSSADGSPQGRPPMFQNFSPINCSSPRKYSNKMNFRSPRQRFYSPVNGRGQRGPWRNPSGLSRNTHNASGKDPGNYNRNYNFNRDLPKTTEGHKGASVFFDPTCLVDPWLELSAEYEKKRNETLERCKTSQEQATNETSSTSSESEEVSDQEMEQAVP